MSNVNNWTEGIQAAIAYIEDNLTEEVKIEDIAAKAYVSPFHFQRIFNVLCGFTVGEYIRNRRLSLAAQELTCNDLKIIDIAVKYGYDSPNSFTRAFTKFHGITPSAAKERGAGLKDFAPLKIKLTLEGGTMLEYKITEKLAFTIIGMARRFDAETSYTEIPKYWDEYAANDGHEKVPGIYGLCVDGDGSSFDYYIGCDYLPYRDIPDGYAAKHIPAGTWAVFPCRGAIPDALQNINTKIWSEWLPNLKEYKLAGNYNIEVYPKPPQEKPEDNYCEIWVPLEKINL